MRQRGVKIILDLALFVGFIAEFITREGPDYAIHSWIGIVLIPIIAIHLVGNRAWIKSALARKSSHPEWKLARLNTVLGATAAVCIVTGFPIWLEWSTNGAWSLVHTVTGFVTILVMFAHLWLNRSRISRLLRRPSTHART